MGIHLRDKIGTLSTVKRAPYALASPYALGKFRQEVNSPTRTSKAGSGVTTGVTGGIANGAVWSLSCWKESCSWTPRQSHNIFTASI